MGIGLVGIFIVLLVYLGIVIPLYAVILRGGISIANRIIGPQQSTSETTPLTHGDDDWESTPRDLANPFSAPATVSEFHPAMGGSTSAIPGPKFGHALLIALVQLIASVIMGFIVSFALSAIGGRASIVGAIVNLALTFFVTSALLSGMAPTSFSRAMLAMLMTYVLLVVIALLVGGIVFAFGTVV